MVVYEEIKEVVIEHVKEMKLERDPHYGNGEIVITTMDNTEKRFNFMNAVFVKVLVKAAYRYRLIAEFLNPTKLKVTFVNSVKLTVKDDGLHITVKYSDVFP